MPMMIPTYGVGVGQFKIGLVQFGSVRFGSVRFGSVRFGSVRFGSVRFGSVRFVWFVWFVSVRIRSTAVPLLCKAKSVSLFSNQFSTSPLLCFSFLLS